MGNRKIGFGLGLGLVLAMTIANPSWGQPAASSPAGQSRYELGRRLKQMEATFERCTTAAARARALPHLKKAVEHFFTFRHGEAGRELDAARFGLESDAEPSTEQRWAASLSVNAGPWLRDAAEDVLTVQVAALYATAPAPGLVLGVRVFDGAGATEPMVQVEKAAEAPATLSVLGISRATSETVRVEVVVRLGERVLNVVPLVLSRVARCDARLAELKAAADALSDATTLHATLRARVKALHELRAGRVMESTAFTAAQWLTEAEALATAVAAKQAVFGVARTGDQAVSIVTSNGVVPCRVFVPASAPKPGAGWPVVFALHGAGGSENLFFEGYGNGRTVALCAERGWMCVAPRQGAAGLGAVDGAALLDAVKAIWPIDEARVFVVGHSMGAEAALSGLKKLAGRVAAVAALSGGTAPASSVDLSKVAVFVGCGTEDFALAAGRTLEAALRRRAAASVESKWYDGIEHLTTVQVALPDVFAFFDRVYARTEPRQSEDF